jgi:hypothetical protein
VLTDVARDESHKRKSRSDSSEESPITSEEDREEKNIIESKRSRSLVSRRRTSDGLQRKMPEERS